MGKINLRISLINSTLMISLFCTATSNDSPFEKVTKEDTFIDKTNIIKTFFHPNDSNSSYVLITCPPRFGKSVNLDMIKRFVEYNESQEIINKNRNLFINLQISKDKNLFENFFGNYMVIHLDFLVSRGKTFSEIVAVIREQMKKVFIQYACLFNQSKDTYTVYHDHKVLFERIVSGKATIKELINSLEILANNLFAYYGKDSILLMDNFDSPLRKTWENGSNIKGILTIIQSMLNQALRGNVRRIRYGMLTGISSIIGALIYSEFNDMKRFGFMEEHDYLRYFGFTMEDMEELYNRKQFKIENKLKIEIHRYCNGYQTQFATVRIFNPSLVVDFLKGKKIRDNWPKIGPMYHLQTGLKDTFLRQTIGNCLSTERVTFKYQKSLKLNNLENLEQLFITGNDTFIDTSIYMSLLVEMGYFSYWPIKQRLPVKTFLTSFFISNEHTRLQLAYDVYKFFTTLIDDGERKFEKIFQLLRRIIENDATATQETRNEFSAALQSIFEPSHYKNQSYERLYDDYRLILYAAALYGSIYGKNQDVPKFDTVECSAPISYLTKPIFDAAGGRVDVAILGKNQTTMLLIEVKEENDLFDKLQTVIDRVGNLRPRDRRPMLQPPNYVKFLAIYVNKKHQVEIGFAPTVQYVDDGRWISVKDKFYEET